MSSQAILEVRNVVKLFGGLRALDGVSIEIGQGEIVGLIGPNGAGKTTLFNIIAGVYRPNQGRVVFKGHDITALRPQKRCHLGIARTFQITKPFLNMTVLENVALAAYYGKPRHLTFEQALARATEVLEWVGLADYKDAAAAGLPLGLRKKLELCRAMATNPQLLLLDEVMAGLNPTEVEEMLDVVRKINGAGVTILMIEHVLRALMAVSERVMVLHHGRKIAEGPPNAIVKNEDVIRAYLGGMTQHA